MRLLRCFWMVGLLIFATEGVALAKLTVNDREAWSKSQSKQLTAKCNEWSAKTWLDSYLKIEQDVTKRLQSESEGSLAQLPDDSFYLEFLETYYPQDLLDLVPTAGAFLDCIDEFSAFRHARNSKAFVIRARAWAACLQSENSPLQAQVELAQCLEKLK